MTRFRQSIEDGYVGVIPRDGIRAKGLVKSSEQAIYSAGKMPLEQGTLKSVMRELYEGLRQYCEAVGCLHGYKFLSHESIAYFLEEVLQERSIAARFDRYRRIRNGINYYGDDIPEETVREALAEIPALVAQLKRHFK